MLARPHSSPATNGVKSDDHTSYGYNARDSPQEAATLRRLLVVLTVLTAAMLLSPSAAPADQVSCTGDVLCPNLIPLPAREIQISYLDGQRLLRFSMTSWNAGRGPLELLGSSGGQVDQRIYQEDGTSIDKSAGTLTWHAAHNHYHFDHYAKFTLKPDPLTGNGSPSRFGEKSTFCIIDTDRIDGKLPGAPKRAVYRSCGFEKQGMSVGWGDTYRYYLDGQWIESDGLGDGDYILEIEVDPTNRISETNDGDNTSQVRINITGDKVTLLDAPRRGRP